MHECTHTHSHAVHQGFFNILTENALSTAELNHKVHNTHALEFLLSSSMNISAQSLMRPLQYVERYVRKWERCINKYKSI